MPITLDYDPVAEALRDLYSKAADARNKPRPKRTTVWNFSCRV